WNDADFQEPSGEPAALPVKGARRSFEALCGRYAGERRTAPVLDELLRVRAVRRLADGRIQALSRTYATVRWDPDGVTSLRGHLSEHCSTLLYNLKNPSRPLFARRVINARLDPRYAPLLMRDLERQAESFMDISDDALNDPLHSVKPGSRSGPSV